MNICDPIFIQKSAQTRRGRQSADDQQRRSRDGPIGGWRPGCSLPLATIRNAPIALFRRPGRWGRICFAAGYATKARNEAHHHQSNDTPFSSARRIWDWRRLCRADSGSPLPVAVRSAVRHAAPAHRSKSPAIPSSPDYPSARTSTY